MILTPNTPCSWFDAGRAFDDDVVIFTSLSDWECREYELCVDESPREIWKNGFAHCGSSTSHRLGIGVLFHAAEPSGTLNVRLPAPDRCLISVGQTAHNIHTNCRIIIYGSVPCAIRHFIAQTPLNSVEINIVRVRAICLWNVNLYVFTYMDCPEIWPLGALIFSRFMD